MNSRTTEICIKYISGEATVFSLSAVMTRARGKGLGLTPCMPSRKALYNQTLGWNGVAASCQKSKIYTIWSGYRLETSFLLNCGSCKNNCFGGEHALTCVTDTLFIHATIMGLCELAGRQALLASCTPCGDQSSHIKNDGSSSSRAAAAAKNTPLRPKL